MADTTPKKPLPSRSGQGSSVPAVPVVASAAPEPPATAAAVTPPAIKRRLNPAVSEANRSARVEKKRTAAVAVEQSSADREREIAWLSSFDRTPVPAGAELGELQSNVDAARRLYVASLANNPDLLNRRKPVVEQKAAISVEHKRYMNMMTASLLAPLASSVGVGSILTVAGSGAMMWALSPHFRDQMKGVSEKATVGLRTFLEQRIESKGQRGRELEALANERGRSLHRSGSRKDAYWVKAMERLDAKEAREFEARGGRDAFTPESAALTEIGLDQNYYHRLRSPEVLADASRGVQLTSDYEQMRAHLRTSMLEDGISLENMSQAKNAFIAKSVASGSSDMAALYDEVSHGAVSLVSRPMRNGKGTMMRFVTPDGIVLPLEHPFEVRPPMTPDQHYGGLVDVLSRQLTQDAKLDDDMGRMNGSMLRMTTISSSPAALELFRGVPEMELARRAQDAMEHDGLGPAEFQGVYAGAYVDALGILSHRYPASEELWRERYGEDWREGLVEALHDPSVDADAMGRQLVDDVRHGMAAEQRERLDSPRRGRQAGSLAEREQARRLTDLRRDDRAMRNQRHNAGVDVTGGGSVVDEPSP